MTDTRHRDRNSNRGSKPQIPVNQTPAVQVKSPAAEALPHNIEAEQIVLGAAMLNPAVLDDIDLTTDDFYRPVHATIYAAITANAALGQPTDLIAIVRRLRGEIVRVGGAPYLHTLIQSVPTTANAGYYGRIVAEAARQRKAIEGLTRMLQAVHGGDTATIRTIHGQTANDIAAACLDDVTDIARGPAPIDWADLWTRDFDDIDWLVEPLIERGQAISIVGGAKVGKSLFTLECVAALAAGRSVLGNPASAPMKVLYVDQENTQQDVYRRLTAMHYKPQDLDNLIYLSFANLPPLNTAAGAAALLELVDAHHPEVVVLDTISRMVDGEENSSDTWLDLYRHTLVHLKARRISVIRLDHHGKDADRGARGSSAKQGDIDAEWELGAPGGGNRLRLRRTLTRTGNGDDTVELIRHQWPVLRHEGIGRAEAVAADVKSAIGFLDSMGADVDITRRNAAELLRSVNIRMGNSKIGEALKLRKERPKGWSCPPLGDPPDESESEVGPQDQDQENEIPGQPGPGPSQDHQDQDPGLGGRRGPSTYLTGTGTTGPSPGDPPEFDPQIDVWPTIPPPGGVPTNVDESRSRGNVTPINRSKRKRK